MRKGSIIDMRGTAKPASQGFVCPPPTGESGRSPRSSSIHSAPRLRFRERGPPRTSPRRFLVRISRGPAS